MFRDQLIEEVARRVRSLIGTDRHLTDRDFETVRSEVKDLFEDIKVEINTDDMHEKAERT